MLLPVLRPTLYSLGTRCDAIMWRASPIYLDPSAGEVRLQLWLGAGCSMAQSQAAPGQGPAQAKSAWCWLKARRHTLNGSTRA
jgi:hypothetical protein